MKPIALSFVAAVALAVAATGVGQALATPSHAPAPKTLRIAMHDPGCHWFAVSGKFAKTASVAGPIRVANFDEAALKVTGHGRVQRIPVGKSILVTRGTYVTTMVGQAPDDNHLKLTVR